MNNSTDILLYALMTADTEQVQYLATKGTTILPDDTWIIYEVCLQGPTMMQALSCNPHIDLNPKIPGQQGDCVIHHLLRTQSSKFAADKNDTIKWLLAKGINPVIPNRRGDTALHILAAEPEGYELLDYFFSDMADVPEYTRTFIRASIDDRNYTTGNTALLVATQYKQERNVQLLLENGASPHIRGEFGRSPLFFAVARNCVKSAKLLLQHGAELGLDIVPLSPEMVDAIGH